MKEKAIGLDLGTTSLGIAVSDSLGLVHPRKAFFFPKKAYRRAIAYFYSLVEETGIKTAALGLPLNMDGTEGESALRSRKFKEIGHQNRPRRRAPYHGRGLRKPPQRGHESLEKGTLRR